MNNGLYTTMFIAKELRRIKLHNRHKEVEPHGNKVMVGVRWEHLGITHLECLRRNKSLNAHLNTQQLQRLHKCLVEKRSVRVNRLKKLFFFMTIQSRIELE